MPLLLLCFFLRPIYKQYDLHLPPQCLLFDFNCEKLDLICKSVTSLTIGFNQINSKSNTPWTFHFKLLKEESIKFRLKLNEISCYLTLIKPQLYPFLRKNPKINLLSHLININLMILGRIHKKISHLYTPHITNDSCNMDTLTLQIF